MDAINNINDGLSYTIGLDIVSVIAVCAFAAVALFLAVLAVIVLFKQKSLLAQINNTLMRQSVPAPGFTHPAPVPNTCPKCGALHAPVAGFCQTCGTPLQ